MAIRSIVKVGDPVLSKKCREVENIDDRIITLLDDMIDTLYDSGGVGLAAPQVGVLRRIVIVEIDDKKYEMINPVIIDKRGKQEEIEACLSVPNKYGSVVRPSWAKVRAMDRNGKIYEVEGEGLMARCFCHELDHLDGILYIDKAKEMYDPEDIEEA